MHFSQVIWLYPGTFIGTIPLNLILERYRPLAARNWLVRSVNEVFVKDKGYFWFTAVFLSYIFLYQSNWRVPTKKVTFFLGDYSLNTVILTVTLVWFGGPLIFERVNVATGGHCQEREKLENDINVDVDPAKLGEFRCNKLGYQWVNGFDCSGHFYLLVSVSLLLWRNFLIAQPLLVGGYVRITETGGNKQIVVPHEEGVGSLADPTIVTTDPESLELGLRPSTVMVIFRRLVTFFTLLFLAIWYFLFLITCIFFHTIPEKIVGMVVALMFPLYVERRDRNMVQGERI